MEHTLVGLLTLEECPPTLCSYLCRVSGGCGYIVGVAGCSQLLSVKKLTTYVNYAKYLSARCSSIAMVILPCIQNVMANISLIKKGTSLLNTTWIGNSSSVR